MTNSIFAVSDDEQTAASVLKFHHAFVEPASANSAVIRLGARHLSSGIQSAVVCGLKDLRSAMFDFCRLPSLPPARAVAGRDRHPSLRVFFSNHDVFCRRPHAGRTRRPMHDIQNVGTVHKHRARNTHAWIVRQCVW